MKWESNELNQRFSLKQFLNESIDQIGAKPVKACKKISLSKSRSNPSSQSSTKSESTVRQETPSESRWQSIKSEDVKVKIEGDYGTEADAKNVKIEDDYEIEAGAKNVKMEEDHVVEADIKNVVVKIEEQDLALDNVAKNEDGTYETITIPETSQELEANQGNHTIDTVMQGDASTYSCPICNKDLSYVKSSYFRQKHVEECLSSNEEAAEETLEYDSCVFCGRDLKHFNADRRQIHLNRCLDSIAEAEDGRNEETYAGHRVPFLQSLEICPVCHEFAPFVNRQVKQKITHIKQCSKKNKVNLPELIRKFQWIGWGHLPVANASKEEQPSVFEPLPVVQDPQHELVAYVQDIDNNDFEFNADFNQNVHIHKKRRIISSSKSEDKNDEELQTVLALSHSMKEVEKQSRRKERIKPSDERDWNAANIISMEESRMKAISKLDALLFPTTSSRKSQLERERSIGVLNPSRLPCINLFYWNLASNSDNNWNNLNTFVAPFLTNLKIHK